MSHQEWASSKIAEVCWRISLFFAPALVISNFLYGEQPGVRRPELYIESPSVDADWSMDDGPYEHTFEYVNIGNEPLELEVKSTSCTCVLQELSPHRVEPGERGYLRVGVAPERLSANKTTVLSIALQSNDPIVPLTQLTVTIAARKNVSSNPTIVDFGETEWKRGKMQAELIVQFTGPEVDRTIGAIVSSSPSISIEPVDRIQANDNSSYRYRVLLDPTNLGGRFVGSLSVETSSLTVPALEIPIRALISLPSTTSPSRIQFRGVVLGGYVEREVTLSLDGGTSEPKYAVARDPDLSAELVPSEVDPLAHTLRCVFRPSSERGTLNSEIDVYDAQGIKLARVPVSGYVKAR